jgi:hypothetical protein
LDEGSEHCSPDALIEGVSGHAALLDDVLFFPECTQRASDTVRRHSRECLKFGHCPRVVSEHGEDDLVAEPILRQSLGDDGDATRECFDGACAGALAFLGPLM